MRYYFCLSLCLFFVAFVKNSIASDVKKLNNKNFMNKIMRPFYPKRMRHAYKHSLLRHDRNRSDVNPTYPLVDVWQYQYEPVKGKIITSDKPIATKKKHWKHKDEARIISVTLYGSDKAYLKGLLDYIDSIEVVNKANAKEDEMWGYKTFTFRVYVAKRNPKRLKSLSQIKNATDDRFIAKLLKRGCEIAFVDNGQKEVKKDATFWRFMIAAEKMPAGQRIRYLVRDADWWLSGAELFTVLEWVKSGLKFHRMNLFSMCLGPLTASIWGGTHVGEGFFSDMKDRIEYYPYRTLYGDDEMFTRDIIWPMIKASGSVLTHVGKRGLIHKLVNPYKNSCQEPTQKFCDQIRSGGTCIDLKLPKGLHFPQKKLGLRTPLKKVKSTPKYFIINGKSKRIKQAKKVL